MVAFLELEPSAVGNFLERPDATTGTGILHLLFPNSPAHSRMHGKILDAANAGAV
jgi:hypothetical protein